MQPHLLLRRLPLCFRHLPDGHIDIFAPAPMANGGVAFRLVEGRMVSLLAVVGGGTTVDWPWFNPVFGGGQMGLLTLLPLTALVRFYLLRRLLTEIRRYFADMSLGCHGICPDPDGDGWISYCPMAFGCHAGGWPDGKNLVRKEL